MPNPNNPNNQNVISGNVNLNYEELMRIFTEQQNRYAQISAYQWPNVSSVSSWTITQEPPPATPAYPDPPPTVRETEQLNFEIGGRTPTSTTIRTSRSRFTVEPERRRHSPNVGSGTVLTLQRMTAYGGVDTSLYVVLTPEQCLELARMLHRHGAVAQAERESNASTASTE